MGSCCSVSKKAFSPGVVREYGGRDTMNGTGIIANTREVDTSLRIRSPSYGSNIATSFDRQTTLELLGDDFSSDNGAFFDRQTRQEPLGEDFSNAYEGSDNDTFLDCQIWQEPLGEEFSNTYEELSRSIDFPPVDPWEALLAPLYSSGSRDLQSELSPVENRSMGEWLCPGCRKMGRF